MMIIIVMMFVLSLSIDMYSSLFQQLFLKVLHQAYCFETVQFLGCLFVLDWTVPNTPGVHCNWLVLPNKICI